MVVGSHPAIEPSKLADSPERGESMRSRQPCSGYPAPVPRRLWRAPGLASVLAPALALTLLSCGDGAEPPTAPQSAAQTPASTLATAVGGALLFRQVSAGDSHTCGVTTDDRAYCWGVTPAPVKGGLRFLEVSAGGGTTCGVTTTQRAYCWGGDLTPVEVPGGRHFRQVSVGLNYICGVN